MGSRATQQSSPSLEHISVPHPPFANAVEGIGRSMEDKYGNSDGQSVGAYLYQSVPKMDAGAKELQLKKSLLEGHRKLKVEPADTVVSLASIPDYRESRQSAAERDIRIKREVQIKQEVQVKEEEDEVGGNQTELDKIIGAMVEEEVQIMLAECRVEIERHGRETIRKAIQNSEILNPFRETIVLSSEIDNVQASEVFGGQGDEIDSQKPRGRRQSSSQGSRAKYAGFRYREGGDLYGAGTMDLYERTGNQVQHSIHLPRSDNALVGLNSHIPGSSFRTQRQREGLPAYPRMDTNNSSLPNHQNSVGFGSTGFVPSPFMPASGHKDYVPAFDFGNAPPSFPYADDFPIFDPKNFALDHNDAYTRPPRPKRTVTKPSPANATPSHIPTHHQVPHTRGPLIHDYDPDIMGPIPAMPEPRVSRRPQRGSFQANNPERHASDVSTRTPYTFTKTNLYAPYSIPRDLARERKWRRAPHDGERGLKRERRREESG